MSAAKRPLSLRSFNRDERRVFRAPLDRPKKVAGVAAVLASGVGAVAVAENATTTLPPVKVDAPSEKPRPLAAPKAKPVAIAAAKPRRAHAPSQHATHVARGGASGPASASTSTLAGAGGEGTGAAATGPVGPADGDPYADPAAPYKANRVASLKFTEPILNTPRTITVLTQEVLQDKNATSLREIARSTAGVTLGTGEGGNAFGDRFFIRGFDARNDVFVDGIRDPAVSVRETFYAEQVEILRGPGSTFAGRGTAGGAVNIVTKQATDRGDFYDGVVQGSPSDGTKRVTLDVNKVINPVLAVRLNGLFQDANVAGRGYVVDDRNGVAGSVVFKPFDNFKLSAEYNHVRLSGLPDFGVPYNRITNRPFTEGVIPRASYFGLVNRDFQRAGQDFGTLTAEYRVNDAVLLTNKTRQERAVLNYVGTLAESPTITPNIIGSTVSLNPQSRYQVANVTANQTEGLLKFDTGPVKHAVVPGVEISREFVTRDTYSGLNSEGSAGGFSGSGSLTANLFLPPNELPVLIQPYRSLNPTYIGVDTKSGYLIETANYQDVVLVNGGVRYDDYHITSRSASTWAENNSGLINYNGGLVLKPLPYASLYAAYATSANPVGAELDGSAANYGGLNAADQIFPPQYNRASEIGTKWELFDRRLLATAALFKTTVSGAREVIGGVTTAEAAYRIQGLDLEAAGKVTDKWSLIGGLVLMDSRVTKSYAPTNVGLQLANIAHQSFSLLSKYELTDMIEVGGQAVYASRIYGGSNLAANGATSLNASGLPAPTKANPFINVPTELPSHWRFDVFAEAKVGPNITMKLFVANLFDRTYYDAFYQSAAPFALIAPGRSVTIEARMRF
ncbi:TonB-dependent receptor [Methylocystis bryophila]|uniref:TonB-dependent siderophore receptor n=1 Tax=Methylocystis bryophila TaxID=655015 RepID=A0A1W6MSE7_9HYPH|nr:TonB-dependent receptor plug domain-containing protein [Methylocystis bryophila]ARN80482.1 TonB-dependent siderophore receptor [Methylocystis bryophila]